MLEAHGLTSNCVMLIRLHVGELGVQPELSAMCKRGYRQHVT